METLKRFRIRPKKTTIDAAINCSAAVGPDALAHEQYQRHYDAQHYLRQEKHGEHRPVKERPFTEEDERIDLETQVDAEKPGDDLCQRRKQLGLIRLLQVAVHQDSLYDNNADAGEDR